MVNLVVGQTAPDFTTEDSLGHQVSLYGLHGKTVILFFYPKDATPG